jgi:crossover junction endodeoxyribonuclease RuvC
MLALGIDPGTATTGYGLVRLGAGDALELVEFGVVTTPAQAGMGERLRQLHTSISALLKLHRPESAAVEKLFFQRNVSTAMSVGQARGVVLLALAQAGVDTAEYSPREVKQAVAGYGGADKRQMQEMIRALLGMAALPQPDDAADALAVAVCHLYSARFRRRLEQAG